MLHVDVLNAMVSSQSLSKKFIKVNFLQSLLNSRQIRSLNEDYYQKVVIEKRSYFCSYYQTVIHVHIVEKKFLVDSNINK